MNVLPLYHRVFLALRDRIVNGVYDAQVPLPTEKQLCLEYTVSRATVRRAMELLEEEGLIVRRQGVRTYARALGYKATQQRRNLDLLTQNKEHLKILPGDIDQSYQVIKPDKDISRQFAYAEKLGRVARIRLQSGQPYCYVVTYLPLQIADQINWPGLGVKPVITAAVEAGYEFVKTEQVITATVADDELAAAMETPIGAPLLRLSGLFLDDQNNAIMRKDGYFHPDGFEYRMTLYNDK